MSDNDPNDGNAKDRDFEEERRGSDGEYLTTNHGARVSHTDDSLKAGERRLAGRNWSGFEFAQKGASVRSEKGRDVDHVPA